MVVRDEYVREARFIPKEQDEKRCSRQTHIWQRNLFPAKPLHQSHEAIKRHDLGVRQHEAVQRARVRDDARGVAPDVAVVRQRHRRVAGPGDREHALERRVTGAARGEVRDHLLHPPAHVYDRVGEVQALDLGEAVQFLRRTSVLFINACPLCPLLLALAKYFLETPNVGEMEGAGPWNLEKGGGGN